VTSPADPAARLAVEIGGKLAGHAGALGVALARWIGHDRTRPDAEARQAANTAMDEIDAALRELHAVRSWLTGSIREADDLAAERADELLARLRRLREDAAARGHDRAPGAS
jgi:hypothetical protein